MKQIKSIKTGELFEVCQRSKDNLLGMPYEGITVKNKEGTHFYLPSSKMDLFEEVQ